MGLLVFYAWLGWVGGAGRVDLGLDGVVPRRTGLMTVDALLAGNSRFWNAINHLILPASLLGFHSLAYISRMTRSFMLESVVAGVHYYRPGERADRAPGYLEPCVS